MEIKIKLRDVMKSDRAIKELGLNPWCMNEGANGDDLITATVEDAKRWGLIKPFQEWDIAYLLKRRLL